MIAASKQRPAALHDSSCAEVRWVHHLPWRPGAAVIERCLGCTAVRRVDGRRIRLPRRAESLAVSS